MNWDDVLKEVEDYLFPKMELSQRDRSLYYHVLLHTRFAGKDSGLFSLPPLSTALGIAERSIREGMRILQDKGCIRIDEISRRGHLIRAFLPSEIDGLVPTTEFTQPIDLESMTEEEPIPLPPMKSNLDALPQPERSNPNTLPQPKGGNLNALRQPEKSNPNALPQPEGGNLNTLLAKEAGHCFFCLRKLPQGTYKAGPTAPGLGMNHLDRNVVVSCPECTSQKQGTTDENFLRQLYRKGFLSAGELEERLLVLGNLQTAKVQS